MTNTNPNPNMDTTPDGVLLPKTNALLPRPSSGKICSQTPPIILQKSRDPTSHMSSPEQLEFPPAQSASFSPPTSTPSSHTSLIMFDLRSCSALRHQLHPCFPN